MTKINKLILFDWGNIVESHSTGFSNRDAWDKLFRECGYTSEEQVFEQLGKYRLSTLRNRNEFEEVFNQMKNDFNLNTTYDEFISIYNNVFDNIDYYPEVADYEHSLKDKCYIGILSDLTIFDKERLNKQVDLSKYDYVFLSFELGMKKPEDNIYEYVMEHVPFNKKDILFIDDRENNIDTAKRMGWNTLHTTGLNLDLIKKTCEEFIKEEGE